MFENKKISKKLMVSNTTKKKKKKSQNQFLFLKTKLSVIWNNNFQLQASKTRESQGNNLISKTGEFQGNSLIKTQI